tara:strand:- start:349 stop:672 length:324 start_codon:yes stop_codon:yes gene_type:complete
MYGGPSRWQFDRVRSEIKLRRRNMGVAAIAVCYLIPTTLPGISTTVTGTVKITQWEIWWRCAAIVTNATTDTAYVSMYCTRCAGVKMNLAVVMMMKLICRKFRHENA